MARYTAAQAAALTGLPLAAVHKAIDRRLIRPLATRSGPTVRRLITKEQLIFLQLEAEGLRLLPLGTRREIAELLQRSPKIDRLPVGNGTALRRVTLPVHLVHNLGNTGALGPLEHRDHLGCFAAFARPGGFLRLRSFLALGRGLGRGGLLGRLAFHRRALRGLCATGGLF